MDATRARDLLTAQRDRLQEALAGLEGGGDVGVTEQEATGDLAAYDQHPAEEGTETQAAETDAALTNHMRAELDEVDAAFARLDDGTYGRCQVCDRPIGDERLEAVPTARYCIDHETEAEEAAAALGRPAEPRG